MWLSLFYKYQMSAGAGQAARPTVLAQGSTWSQAAVRAFQRALGPFKDCQIDTKLGTTSRLYSWTVQLQDWLCVTHLHTTNRAGSYSWIKGTPFMGKRTMEPH